MLYILVVTLAVGGARQELPGLGRIECEELAAEARQAQRVGRAECVPDEAAQRMPIICPFSGGCWRARSPTDVIRPWP
jgi:hypothetical protein